MTATLYGSMLSPHVAKVVIQIRHKGLDIPLAPPPGGIRSEEYLKISPLGKIPSLDIGGQSIFESRAICEYLEMTAPEQPMWSDDPVQKAREVAIAAISDLYIAETATALFPMLNPEKRIDVVVDRQIAATEQGLKRLEAVLVGPLAAGGELTLADCSAGPYLFSALALLKAFGVAEPLALTSKVAAYWQTLQSDPIVKPVFDEMAEATKPYLG